MHRLPALLILLAALPACEPQPEGGTVAVEPPAVAQDPPAPAGDPSAEAAMAEVLRQLASQKLRVDLGRGLIEIDAEVCQIYEPLEYLLITQPRGKDHESLFLVNDLNAAALNAAMLLLGVEKGLNGRFVAVDPPPTREEYQAGVRDYTVEPADGDGFYIYASWEETRADGVIDRRFHRVEDLVLNVRSERTYERGKFVYLGSRFIKPHKDAEELFAADAEGNLVSLIYFPYENHLLTGKDSEADNQYIWFPNTYLLPPIGHPVRLLFSLEPLETPAPRVIAPAGR
ncbi:MAG: hypothetical protein H8E31_05740 [Planctomycetes bacterium]|nr:hypothetical protein [Planctomycetota bacterium]